MLWEATNDCIYIYEQYRKNKIDLADVGQKRERRVDQALTDIMKEIRKIVPKEKKWRHKMFPTENATYKAHNACRTEILKKIDPITEPKGDGR